MTLIYELYLKILKTIYCLPEMNFLGQGFQKIKHCRLTDRQTDRQRDRHADRYN